MRLQILFWTLVLVTSSAFAQGIQAPPPTGLLKVTVVNFARQPIPFAFVLIHRNGPGRDVKLSLDSAGQAETSLPVGVYHVFVSADTFIPICSAIRVHSDQRELFFAALKVDEEHLEQ